MTSLATTVDIDTGEMQEPASQDMAQGVKFYLTGLVMPEGYPLESCLALLEQLSIYEKATQWWLGDALNATEREHGDKYAQAIDPEQAHVWAQYAYVAANVQISTRVENLSWTHHRVVASFGPSEQAEWLAKAEAEQWSERELRTALKTERHTKAVRDSIQQPAIIEHADALEWLAKQEPADLLLTDPPYMTDVEDVATFAQAWLPKALAAVKPSGRAFVFVGAYPEELHAYLNVKQPDQILVWTYRNTLGPSPSHRYKLNWQAILYYQGEDAPPLNCDQLVEQFSVQDVNAPDGRLGDRYHAWQKPLDLAERFVRHATPEGGTVIDPFACTGTFLLAASRLGRFSFGCDNSEDHLRIAVERGCSRA